MSKKKKVVRWLTAFTVAVMLISTVLSVTMSASGDGTYYGSSPSISDISGSLNLGTENLLNESVMYKLPDTVKPSDDISVIVQMKTDDLLDAYEASDSKLSFTDFVLTEEADEVRANIANEAETLRESLEGINYTVGVDYNVVLSGFELIIKAEDFADVCKAISDKAQVFVGEKYNPAETQLVENKVNVYGTGIFNSDKFQQEYGFDGTGMVVAVLDTGIDYYHSAFLDRNYTADRNKLGLTFSEVSSILANNELAAEKREAGLTPEDVYISDKIPFGFDYADNDSDVFPLLSNHGTHVSGVIAGNKLDHIESEDYSGQFVGVAPGAQIAAMKIFSDVEATARTSWILGALEDCVILGVDVINMSIGTACGFSRETDKEIEAGVYDRIREKGISLVVAASNSFNSSYSSDKNGNLPLTSNPDSATVGSPSTYKGALCVASIEGAKTPYLTYNGSIIYFNESTDRFSESKKFVDELLGGGKDSIEIEYVLVAGAGRTAADYTGIDVKGKIALIKRGYNTFEEKASLAEEMGAAGVIIYNNVSGDIRMNVGEVSIPVCSISQDDGEILAEAGSGKIVISRSQTSGPFISDFSSWGPTPDLQIKPEITAHGGSILSSVPGESYDRISGTSMATPNVSGVTALLRQYVINNERFGYDREKDSVEIAAMVNRLLMSTADITFGKNGLPYAVRKQGAGLANLTDSAATDAYIATYNKDGSLMDKSKIELGDDPTKTGVYTLNFGIVNFGSETLSYDLGYYVLTEGVSETKTAQGETTVTEEAFELKGAKVEILSVDGGALNGESISVEGGKTAKVSVRITLTDDNKKYLDESFENGMYVEGFITLDNADDTQDLSFPYLAFYGDWTKAPLFDLDFYETNADELDDSIDPLDKTLPDAYASRPIGGSVGDYVSYLGSYYFEQNPANKIIAADRKYISLSNQTANNEINSLRFVWAGMLRNAQRVEVVITEDSTGEVVFRTTDYDIRKSYGDGGPIRPANIDIEFSAIDNNLKNNTQYTVTMKGYLDYGEDGGADSNLNNTFTFPITTDFSAPVLTDCEFYTEYDRSSKTNRLFARLAIYDNHYAMAVHGGYVGLSSDGSAGFSSFGKYATPVYSEYNSTTYVEYELTDHIDDIMSGAYTKNTFVIACYDYAMNSSTFEIALPDDFTAFGFESPDGGITQELEITLSPNEIYNLSPVVYPATEWGELITYRKSTPSKAVNIVGNKIIAVQSGGATIKAQTPDGKTATIRVLVLGPDDEGYKEYSKPVADSFNLTGYYVNRAFYMLDNTQRDIGETGNEMKFASNNYYSLSMFPSESVTLRHDLRPYFPESTTVEYSSGNEKIATVDQSGRITAVDEGIVSITAKVMMDNKSTLYSATVTINVKEPFVTSGPSLSNYYGAGDSANHVIFPSTLAITEIGQFAFSNYDYVDKDPSELGDPEAPETMKMWFLGDSEVKRVTIPEGVTRIGPYAFAGIQSLERIDLPSTLETIDYGAFYGCTNLKVVNGIENVKFINQSAFQGCSLTGDINLGNAVAIADYAFSECAAIKSVHLPATLQSIGSYAFGANTALTSVEIDAEKIKLGSYAFTNCTALQSISINTAVIPTGAFNECSSLTTVNFGKDVSVIEEYAFRNARVSKYNVDEGNTTFKSHNGGEYLTNMSGTEILLVAPTRTVFELYDSNITSVGVGAFSGNAQLISVKIPSVTKVSSYAFSECEKLKNVELGDLTEIGSYAFENTAVDTFEFRGDVKIGEYAFSRSKITTITIGDGLKVPTGAFANCTKLETVVIGDNVVIGDFAFYNDQYHAEPEDIVLYYYNSATGQKEPVNSKIYRVKFDGSIKSLTIGDNAVIGDYAFYGASNLQSAALGEGAKIGEYAFYNCVSLSDIDLSKVTSIGESAFSGDIHFVYTEIDYTNIYINENGEYTYCYYAPAFTSVDLSSLESLGENAFALCKKLESVTLGEKLDDIPTGAFQYCDVLSKINLENIKTVGDYAFAECALEGVDLTNATEIGKYAFCYNAEMLSATLGTDNVIIGEGAFSYCDSLAELVGEEKASYIGDYAFACTSICKVDFTNATYIGTQALYKEETTPVSVILGTLIKDMGDNPFAGCIIEPLSRIETESFLDKDYEKTVYTFDIGNNIKVIDGSIYKVVPNGLELISWMGEDVAIVADNTVRISAMAFAGQDIRQVVLPSTVKAIGHKAFYGCNKLMFVSFSSYDAPILEEEYDSAYYESMEHIPSIGEYNFEDYYGNPIVFEGQGLVPFFMWNVTDLPCNFFYGANFVDYVGSVEDKITMIRPSNGKNYDSFIFNQYFALTIDGATAADKITLAAIETIKGLPTNVKDIKLEDKPLVEAARAAYNKIMTDEQRALVSGDVLEILTNAEKRIADLEYLMSEKDETPTDGSKEQTNLELILNVVIGTLFIIVVIGFIVVMVIFIRLIKMNPQLLKKPEPEVVPLSPEEEKARLKEIAKYVEAAKPTPAPKIPKKPINKAPNIDELVKKYREGGRKVNIPVIIAIALAVVIVVAGVIWFVTAGNDNYFSDFDDKGYNVKITFDSNGGTFKGSNSSISDLYKLEDIDENGIKLLAPEDPARGKNNTITLTKTDHFFAGWYRERKLIDPEDPDKGYTYSGKWNFDTDTVDIDKSKEYTAEESAFTLYAAWVPYFKYEIYAPGEDGKFEKLNTVSAINLTIPEWGEKDVVLNMDNFPKRDGYTLSEVYYDEAMTQKVVGEPNATGTKKVITGEVDWDTATLVNDTIKLYTTWQEGERYKIYSTEDIIKYADSKGYYEIYADLDFTGLKWPTAFSDGEFSGKFIGNGHTISGVSVESTERAKLNNGLFASLGESAAIENIKFTNITHTINLMDVAPGANFGLLAGVVKDGAKFADVTIDGKIIIGDDCESIAGNTGYTIGTIAGSGNVSGVEADITVEKADPANESFDIVINGNVVTLVKVKN